MIRSVMLALFLAGFISGHAQSDTLPPFKRFPTIPPFRLLLKDSSTVFTKDQLKKNKPVLLMVFSPECDHCQHEAEELVKNKEHFENVQIVMSTTYPFYEQAAFYNKYHLSELKNLVMGKDYQYILPSFFMLRNFPYLALYNKKKELITTFEGSYPVKDVLEAFHR